MSEQMSDWLDEWVGWVGLGGGALKPAGGLCVLVPPPLEGRQHMNDDNGRGAGRGRWKQEHEN